MNPSVTTTVVTTAAGSVTPSASVSVLTSASPRAPGEDVELELVSRDDDDDDESKCDTAGVPAAGTRKATASLNAAATDASTVVLDGMTPASAPAAPVSSHSHTDMSLSNLALSDNNRHTQSSPDRNMPTGDTVTEADAPQDEMAEQGRASSDALQEDQDFGGHSTTTSGANHSTTGPIGGAQRVRRIRRRRDSGQSDANGPIIPGSVAGMSRNAWDKSFAATSEPPLSSHVCTYTTTSQHSSPTAHANINQNDVSSVKPMASTTTSDAVAVSPASTSALLNAKTGPVADGALSVVSDDVGGPGGTRADRLRLQSPTDHASDTRRTGRPTIGGATTRYPVRAETTSNPQNVSGDADIVTNVLDSTVSQPSSLAFSACPSSTNSTSAAADQPIQGADAVPSPTANSDPNFRASANQLLHNITADASQTSAVDNSVTHSSTSSPSSISKIDSIDITSSSQVTSGAYQTLPANNNPADASSATSAVTDRTIFVSALNANPPSSDSFRSEPSAMSAAIPSHPASTDEPDHRDSRQSAVYDKPQPLLKSPPPESGSQPTSSPEGGAEPAPGTDEEQKERKQVSHASRQSGPGRASVRLGGCGPALAQGKGTASDGSLQAFGPSTKGGTGSTPLVYATMSSVSSVGTPDTNANSRLPPFPTTMMTTPPGRGVSPVATQTRLESIGKKLLQLFNPRPPAKMDQEVYAQILLCPLRQRWVPISWLLEHKISNISRELLITAASTHPRFEVSPDHSALRSAKFTRTTKSTIYADGFASIAKRITRENREAGLYSQETKTQDTSRSQTTDADAKEPEWDLRALVQLFEIFGPVVSISPCVPVSSLHAEVMNFLSSRLPEFDPPPPRTSQLAPSPSNLYTSSSIGEQQQEAQLLEARPNGEQPDSTTSQQRNHPSTPMDPAAQLKEMRSVLLERHLVPGELPDAVLVEYTSKRIASRAATLVERVVQARGKNAANSSNTGVSLTDLTCATKTKPSTKQEGKIAKEKAHMANEEVVAVHAESDEENEEREDTDLVASTSDDRLMTQIADYFADMHVMPMYAYLRLAQSRFEAVLQRWQSGQLSLDRIKRADRSTVDSSVNADADKARSTQFTTNQERASTTTDPDTENKHMGPEGSSHLPLPLPNEFAEGSRANAGASTRMSNELSEFASPMPNVELAYVPGMDTMAMMQPELVISSYQPGQMTGSLPPHYPQVFQHHIQPAGSRVYYALQAGHSVVISAAPQSPHVPSTGGPAFPVYASSQQMVGGPGQSPQPPHHTRSVSGQSISIAGPNVTGTGVHGSHPAPNRTPIHYSIPVQLPVLSYIDPNIQVAASAVSARVYPPSPTPLTTTAVPNTAQGSPGPATPVKGAPASTAPSNHEHTGDDSEAQVAPYSRVGDMAYSVFPSQGSAASAGPYSQQLLQAGHPTPSIMYASNVILVPSGTPQGVGFSAQPYPQPNTLSPNTNPISAMPSQTLHTIQTVTPVSAIQHPHLAYPGYPPPPRPYLTNSQSTSAAPSPSVAATAGAAAPQPISIPAYAANPRQFIWTVSPHSSLCPPTSMIAPGGKVHMPVYVPQSDHTGQPQKYHHHHHHHAQHHPQHHHHHHHHHHTQHPYQHHHQGGGSGGSGGTSSGGNSAGGGHSSNGSAQ